MEHEVEKVLCGALLACHLEMTLLKSLEIRDTVVCEEVQAELYRFNLFDDEFDDLQWVALLVNLLDDFWLLDKYRVDKLHKLMLEGIALLSQLAMEYACVVDV